MIELAAITTFLDSYLEADLYADDSNGLWHLPESFTGGVRRLGLALEASDGLLQRAHSAGCDALLLHRPWGLKSLDLPVLAYHLAFDEHLTLGYNSRLADVLGMKQVDVFAYKKDRPLGMIGNIGHVAAEILIDRLKTMFGALETVKVQPLAELKRVCVVGALRADLVYLASRSGADLYLTGQYRAHAQAALDATGINLVACGHRTSELWGLRALAGLLRERFSGLELDLLDDPVS